MNRLVFLGLLVGSALTVFGIPVEKPSADHPSIDLTKLIDEIGKTDDPAKIFEQIQKAIDENRYTLKAEFGDDLEAFKAFVTLLQTMKLKEGELPSKEELLEMLSKDSPIKNRMSDIVDISRPTPLSDDNASSSSESDEHSSRGSEDSYKTDVTVIEQAGLLDNLKTLYRYVSAAADVLVTHKDTLLTAYENALIIRKAVGTILQLVYFG